MVHNALICDFLSMKNTEPPLKKNESNSLLADPPQENATVRAAASSAHSSVPSTSKGQSNCEKTAPPPVQSTSNGQLSCNQTEPPVIPSTPNGCISPNESLSTTVICVNLVDEEREFADDQFWPELSQNFFDQDSEEENHETIQKKKVDGGDRLMEITKSDRFKPPSKMIRTC